MRLVTSAKKQSQRALTFKGTAFSRRGNEPALIAKFMKRLKKDTAFYSDFEDIELGTLMKRNIKNTGMMDFTLTCYFKPRILD